MEVPRVLAGQRTGSGSESTMPKTKATLALAAAIAVALSGNSPKVHATLDRYEQELQPVLERLIREQRLPGFAMAVVEDNRLAYAAGFGVRNVTSPEDRITTRSLFHMASITKPFVATSLMQLVENGKVDLDVPIATYLPYFRMADDRYK